MPLGCAQDYQATLHYQGGRQLFTQLDGLTALSWGRKLDDYSEASVTVAKRDASAGCLHQAGRAQPWAHELTIYRDGGIVWQGPIVEIEETRSELTFTARDMLAWLDRRVIDTKFPKGQAPLDTGEMLHQIMTKTFPEGDPYNNPGISEYMRVDRQTPGAQSFPETIWPGSQTVGELVRELIKSGIDMFTLGRKIYLIPDFWRFTRNPFRLSARDFLGDLSVLTRGLDTATEGFVLADSDLDPNGAQPAPPDPDDAKPPTVAKYPPGHHGGAGDPSAPPWYGRITRFTEAGQQVDSEGALLDVDKSIRAYGFPPPKSIVVPDSAQLSPEAPVRIGQLVAGRTFRVDLDDFAMPTSEPFRLSEVEVTWSSDTTEQVAISLETIRQPPVEDQS